MEHLFKGWSSVLPSCRKWLREIDTIVKNINGIPSHIERVANWLSTDTVRQLYQYLSDNKYNSPHFLKRVLYGFTTTHNESLHRMLTRKVPKTGKVSYETYRLGAALAVIQYNDGVTALVNILRHLGIDPRKRIRDLFIELLIKRREHRFKDSKSWM